MPLLSNFNSLIKTTFKKNIFKKNNLSCVHCIRRLGTLAPATKLGEEGDAFEINQGCIKTRFMKFKIKLTSSVFKKYYFAY